MCYQLMYKLHNNLDLSLLISWAKQGCSMIKLTYIQNISVKNNQTMFKIFFTLKLVYIQLILETNWYEPSLSLLFH